MFKNSSDFTLAYRPLPLYTYYSGYSRQGVKGKMVKVILRKVGKADRIFDDPNDKRARQRVWALMELYDLAPSDVQQTYSGGYIISVPKEKM